MKKRLLSLLTVLALIPGTLQAYASTPPSLTLSADTDTLSPGEDVCVTLTLDQSISQLNNYQFNVIYDATRFELSGSEAAEPTKVSAPRKDELGGETCITISGLSTEGKAVSLAAGTVATLTFTALEEAEPGEAVFTLRTQALPTYADLAPVPLTLVNDATVTLTEAADAVLKGDVNDDGKINVIDAVLVRSHVLRKKLLEGAALTAGDVNSDGKINVIDAVLVRRYVLNQITVFP